MSSLDLYQSGILQSPRSRIVLCDRRHLYGVMWFFYLFLLFFFFCCICLEFAFYLRVLFEAVFLLRFNYSDHLRCELQRMLLLLLFNENVHDKSFVELHPSFSFCFVALSLSSNMALSRWKNCTSHARPKIEPHKEQPMCTSQLFFIDNEWPPIGRMNERQQQQQKLVERLPQLAAGFFVRPIETEHKNATNRNEENRQPQSICS